VYDFRLIFRLIPIIKKYDIVHTHNTACQFFVAIAKVISGAKCRLVTTEHNTDNRRRHIYGFKMIDKWMYHQYDTIIAISNKAAELLEKYIGIGFHIRTIVNGVNVKNIRMRNLLWNCEARMMSLSQWLLHSDHRRTKIR
jgi:hypothetical protein